jgi:hypothetical protein
MNVLQVLAGRQAARAVIVTVVLVSISCFPDRQATLVEKDHMDTLTVVEAPAKVFMMDASVALFPEGFRLKENILLGQGWRFSSIDVVQDIPLEKLPRVLLRIPRDSTVAMTYFEKIVTTGRGFASFFLGLTGGVLTPLSIYCLSNPKACFGSCPTVYTRNGDKWEFAAELFSYSISRLLESGDLDRLGQRGSSGSPFTLRVANEALETHHINLMRLVAVRHPVGTLAFPATDGSIVAVRDLREPCSAVNSEGKDILQAVRYWDDRAYRSDSIMVRQVKSGRTSDWIDLRVRPTHRNGSVTLLLRLKNTLLSTVLFYEIVLASQGVRAIDWTERMNSDRLYAAQFRCIYSEFSGVKIKMWCGGRWMTMGVVPDVGPVGWKPVAVRVPVENDGEVALRLEFFPDNMMIDYAGFDVGGDESVLSASELVPSAVRDRTGALRSDILSLVSDDDERYLVTEPGDVYRFVYDIPPAVGEEVTLFLRSKGYYTEWIRRGWITAPVGLQRFDLYRIDQTMMRLSELWIRDRATMESLFFRTRIPVTEDL